MLLECLSKVADPRRGQGRRYGLEYLLLFSVLAMLCGATSYRQIQRFIKAHRERLNAWFELPWKRAPAHPPLRNLLQARKPEPLEQAFRAHSQPLWDPPPESEVPPAIALDGNVLRGSFARFQDPEAAQVLSAFCQGERLILGHLPVSSQTNEIPVAQQLIEELGLEGCLYPLDALHCQKKTFDIALPRGSEVITQGKGNQPARFEAVQSVEMHAEPLDQARQFNHERSRIERRETQVFEAAPGLASLPEPDGWSPRMAAVIRVYRDTDGFDTRTGTWKRRTETASYVATHLHPAEVFANVIRGHLGH